MAILSGIIGIVITIMNRGASNVQKGSFNVLAANQAFWIVSVIRSDIARSIDKINFNGDGGVWKGGSTFEVDIEGGKASYSIEKHGDNIKFVRKFTPSGTNSEFLISDSKTQKFGDEYMTDLSITEKKEEGVVSYYLEITMKEPNKSLEGNNEFVWTSYIYAPVRNEIEKYWVSTEAN